MPTPFGPRPWVQFSAGYRVRTNNKKRSSRLTASTKNNGVPNGTCLLGYIGAAPQSVGFSILRRLNVQLLVRSVEAGGRGQW